MVLVVSMLAISVMLTGCSSIGTAQASDDIIVAKAAGQEIKKSYYDDMFNIFKVQQEQNYGPEIWEKEVKSI